MVALGVAVSVLAAEPQLFKIRLQLLRACSELLVSALLYRFVPALSMHKAGFIQVVQPGIRRKLFLQVLRHIFLVRLYV